MKSKDEPSSSVQVVKRGRGRPRKVIAEPAVSQVVKRGRGRPRKAIAEPVTIQEVKRGRGRPRKVIAELIGQVTNKTADIVPVAAKPGVKIEYFHFRPNALAYLLNDMPRKGRPEHDDLEPSFMARNPFPHGGMTICKLSCDGLTVRAAAYCSYSDVFNRKKGRELSYQRASAVMDLLLPTGITGLSINVKPLGHESAKPDRKTGG